MRNQPTHHFSPSCTQLSWVPSPNTMGMHPRGRNSCSQSNRLMGTSTLRCRDVSPWSYFSDSAVSQAPPPYIVGMCPHGHNSCSQSNRLTGTSTLCCGDASPWSYFSDFTVSQAPPPYTVGMCPHGCISVLSILGHLHPLLITHFYQLVRP